MLTTLIGYGIKGFMTYDEFRRQLGKAGVSVKEFADLVKLHRNSVTNYAKGGIIPSHWAIVVVLMGEMAENKIDFREALRRLEISPNKVRGSAVKGRFGIGKQAELNLTDQEDGI